MLPNEAKKENTNTKPSFSNPYYSFSSSDFLNVKASLLSYKFTPDIYRIKLICICMWHNTLSYETSDTIMESKFVSNEELFYV